MFNKEVLWGTVRHIVGAVGAFVVALGYASADGVADALGSIDTIIGSAAVVVAFVASVVAKIKGTDAAE
jgi:hypothetical protein